MQSNKDTDGPKQAVDSAYAAYVALKMMEAYNPELAQNPYFTALVDTAHARFSVEFDAEIARKPS